VGTHWQIEEILKNYFKPCKFGNVEVKITIGYVTGKYLELVNIYNHCLNLLK